MIPLIILNMKSPLTVQSTNPEVKVKAQALKLMTMLILQNNLI